MYNTFGIDAKSLYFEEASTIKDLKTILKDEKYLNVKKLILGGGSNLLFVNDFDGLVIKMSIKGKKIVKEDLSNVYIKVGAGESWDKFVAYTVENGFGGLENLSGIPGTVGAAPIQNIGAYGSELKDTFVSLDSIDIETSEIKTFSKSKCEFGYRNSIFKSSHKDCYVITHVTFRVSKNPKINSEYRILGEALATAKIMHPTIKDIRKVVLSIRKEKLPDISKIGTAGSFFKNPIVPEIKFTELRKKYPNIHFYVEKNGGFKIPAGWLVEMCGFKGKRYGDCGVYEKQALVLVNYGGATGLDILNLSKEIQNCVNEMFGISLEREVVVV